MKDKKHLCFQSGVKKKPIEFGLWVQFPLLTKFQQSQKGWKNPRA